MALCIPQSRFKLKNAIELAKAFNYHKFSLQKASALENAIGDLINELDFRG